jgi:ketosteroid isomerase-like protein
MKPPDIITRYLDAANRLDASGAAECFTDDAHVHDEGGDYVGPEAVRGWIAETSRKYQPRVGVLSTKVQGDAFLLKVRVAGSFPGSPIELDYAVTLRDGKIATLKIE